MNIKILGSSSSGNGYILQSSIGESLIIDCGVNISHLKKALNFNLSGVVGCLLDHFHGDHSKYFKDYLKAGINVYVEEQSIPYLKGFESHRLKFYPQLKTMNIGSFKVKSFPVQHDIPTVGFLIFHPEMGNLVFITDTAYSNFHFPDLNHILIEANYCENIIFERMMKGELDGFLRNRIQQSHMSFTTTKEFLKANDLSNVRTITLLHLSSGHSDASRFKRETEELTGKPTFIADTGTEIDLSLNPF